MKNSDESLKSGFTQPVAYEFADLRLDLRRHALERNGQALPSSPRMLEALAMLLEHPGELIMKQDLMQRLWPNVIVEDNSLARVMSDLRKALGDSAECIVTVARRGYRFDGRVEPIYRRADTIASARRVLAVLPFAPFTPHEDDRSLAFGIADALTTRLSRIQEVIVRPTSSTARYSNGAKPAAEAGRELKADVILCGSLRRAGTQLRVSVQLIEVEAEATLWADQFDEALSDLFAIEDSISRRVAEALALELSGAQRSSLTRRHTGNPEAYDLYLRGRFLLSRRTGQALRGAADLFARACELDPSFALAFAGIAEAKVLATIPSATLDAAPPKEMVPTAREAALRALSLDANLSEAHAVLGQIAFTYDWDRNGAESAFRRAIEINPHSTTARQFYAMALACLGQQSEAIAEMKRILEIDPTWVVARANLGIILARSGRLNEALHELSSCAAVEPTSAYLHFRYGLVLQSAGRFDDALEQFVAMMSVAGAEIQSMAAQAHLLATIGRIEEARALLNRLKELSTQRYVSAFFLAEVHLGLAEVDLALDWLERAYEERSVLMISLQVNEKLAPLRSHPRFVALVRRVGMWP